MNKTVSTDRLDYRAITGMQKKFKNIFSAALFFDVVSLKRKCSKCFDKTSPENVETFIE